MNDSRFGNFDLGDFLDDFFDDFFDDFLDDFFKVFFDDFFDDFLEMFGAFLLYFFQLKRPFLSGTLLYRSMSFPSLTWFLQSCAGYGGEGRVAYFLVVLISHGIGLAAVES